MENKIYNELIKIINKKRNTEEVPVAAIMIYKNKIIAKYHNKREKNNNVMGHAEIRCIIKTCKKLKTWKLDECTLYVTLKPCRMCENIIKESRIKEVKYIVDKNQIKKEYNKTKFTKINNEYYENNIKTIMNIFFKNKRK